MSGNLVSSGNAILTLSNGPPNSAFLVALASVPAHLDAGSLFLGEIQLDPVNWFLLFSGTLSPLGDFSITIPLTGIAPAFVHTPVYLQAIALDPSGAFWRVSNATVATIRP
ncbi:MAG TPA: hypothetical protein VKF62_01895 [Planctomycetota bacterium]|nr:hypothetical protein [Planctomycetota bacterium]